MFFAEKFIGKKNIRTGQLVEISHIQWTRDVPTAEDFFKAIKSAFQVTDAMKHIKNKRQIFKLYDKVIVKNYLVLENYPLLEFG